MSNFPYCTHINLEISRKGCFVLHEASSSKSSLFLFDEHLNHYHTYKSPARIHEYALSNNAHEYYNEVVTSNFLRDINSSDCDIINWLTFSTGGMRKIESSVEPNHIQNFYSDFKELVSLSNINYEKNLKVKEIRTITAEEEGIFALLSHFNASIVFDLGGATGQITNENGLLYTNYIGKESSRKDIGHDNLDICYNDKLGYQGDKCRALISSHLDTNFSTLFSLNLDNKDTTFVGISNFFNFLNDICGTYIPFLKRENIACNLEVNNLCISKSNKNALISIEVEDYKNIADEFCQYWGNWTGKTANFASDTCFSLNYNYQILKAIGFEDNDSIYISGKDWAEGAVSSYMHHCSYA